MGELSLNVKHNKDSVPNDSEPIQLRSAFYNKNALNFGHDCNCIARESMTPSDVQDFVRRGVFVWFDEIRNQA